jgi:hypothetical protein
MFVMMIVPLASADLGTFQQNSPVEIKTILNTTSVNISTISYPNSTLIISNQAMTKNGLNFNYTFYNTSKLGTYIYSYFDAEGNVYVNSFTITPTGNIFNNALSIPLFMPLILMLLGACLFFFLTHYVENIKYKWAFLILGGIFLVFSMGYGIIASLETLWEFPLLYNFINSFYKVFIIFISWGAIIIAVIAMFMAVKTAFDTRGYNVGGGSFNK